MNNDYLLKFHKTKIAIILILIRLIFLYFNAGIIEKGDSGLYLQISKNIHSHNTISTLTTPPILPTLDREPGYAFFIYFTSALWNFTPITTIYVQIFLDILIMLMLYNISFSLSSNIQLSSLVALLYSLSPQTAQFSIILLSEWLSMFFVIVTFWLILKYLKSSNLYLLIPLGLICGINTLTRPAYILMVIFCVLAVLINNSTRFNQKIFQTILYLTFFSISLSPWLIRNYLITGRVTVRDISSSSLEKKFVNEDYFHWVNTWIYHPRYQELNWSPQNIKQTPIPDYAFDSKSEKTAILSIINDYDSDGIYSQKALEIFSFVYKEKQKNHSIRQYITLPLKRAFFLWVNGRTEMLSFKNTPNLMIAKILKTVCNSFNFAILFLFIMGIVIMQKTAYDWLYVLSLIVITSFHSIFTHRGLVYIEPRYLVPLYPLLFIPSAYSIIYLSKLIKKGHRA